MATAVHYAIVCHNLCLITHKTQCNVDHWPKKVRMRCYGYLRRSATHGALGSLGLFFPVLFNRHSYTMRIATTDATATWCSGCHTLSRNPISDALGSDLATGASCTHHCAQEIFHIHDGSIETFGELTWCLGVLLVLLEGHKG